MLTSVQSLLGNRQVGVVDTENQKLIVPLSYSAITFQKYGIIAHNADGYSDIYQFDGSCILARAKNPLLLDGGFVIASDSSGQCYIFYIGHGKPKALIKGGFESILFYFGTKPDPIIYNSILDLSQLFLGPDYLENGVHFDRYICASRNGYWGVINRDTGKIAYDFNALKIIQSKGAQLVISGKNGLIEML